MALYRRCLDVEQHTEQPLCELVGLHVFLSFTIHAVVLGYRDNGEIHRQLWGKAKLQQVTTEESLFRTCSLVNLRSTLHSNARSCALNSKS